MTEYRFQCVGDDECSSPIIHNKIDKNHTLTTYFWHNSKLSVEDTGNYYNVKISPEKEIQLDYSEAAALLLIFRVLKEEDKGSLMSGTLYKETEIELY